jgi:hypothetical protein
MTIIAAMRGLLRAFRLAGSRSPARIPLPEPLPLQVLAETADRDILLVSREPHKIQNPKPAPGESAAGFPLQLYTELFQSGPARHATWSHVCTTPGAAPLLIHSTPRNSASSSRRVTNRPNS